MIFPLSPQGLRAVHDRVYFALAVLSGKEGCCTGAILHGEEAFERVKMRNFRAKQCTENPWREITFSPTCRRTYVLAVE